MTQLNVAACVAVMLSLALPGAALACLPPLAMTAVEEEASDQAIQADLWMHSDLVFMASVTAVVFDPQVGVAPGVSLPVPMPGQERIHVQLTPITVVKGDGMLPAPYEIRDIFVGCAPRGIQRAQVGQRYLVYGAPSQALGGAEGLVEVERLKDAETLVAVDQAAARAGLEP